MKTLIFFLSIVLFFALISCGKQKSDSSNTENKFENLHGQAGVVDEDSTLNIL